MPFIFPYSSPLYDCLLLSRLNPELGSRGRFQNKDMWLQWATPCTEQLIWISRNEFTSSSFFSRQVGPERYTIYTILLTLFLTSGSENDISTSSHQLRSVQERYPSKNKTRQDCTKISLSCDARLTSHPRLGPPSQKQLIRGPRATTGHHRPPQATTGHHRPPQATTGSMTITAQEMVTNNLNVCGQTALVLLLLAPVLNMHLFVIHSSTDTASCWTDAW